MRRHTYYRVSVADNRLGISSQWQQRITKTAVVGPVA